MEIERKFLLTSLPNLVVKRSAYIEQSYIAFGDTEVRIRYRVNNEFNTENYVLCIKSKGDLCRKEWQKHIDKEEYIELLNFTCNNPITKAYYVYDYNGYEFECSIVDKGKDTEFIYGEIEFKTENDANNFIQPEWMGVDVTYDNSYKMKNYWKKTRGC